MSDHKPPEAVYIAALEAQNADLLETLGRIALVGTANDARTSAEACLERQRMKMPPSSVRRLEAQNAALLAALEALDNYFLADDVTNADAARVLDMMQTAIEKAKGVS